jgi:fatty-acyl-CoA synthase
VKASWSSWSRKGSVRRPGRRRRPQRYRAIVNCGKPVKDMVVEIRDEDGSLLGEGQIGKVWCTGTILMVGYFRDDEATAACMVDGWLDTGDMGYMSSGYLYIVGRAKDMIIINGKNHWPQDIEWAVEQLPGFKQGDIAAFAISHAQWRGRRRQCSSIAAPRTIPNAPGCATRSATRFAPITGMNCVVELVPPRTLPRTSIGQAEPLQGAQALSVGRNRTLRHRGITGS